MCVCPGMKVLSILLLAGLTGFLFGLLGCEKSPDAAEACAADITARLGLVNEPVEPCSLTVFLYQTEADVFYEVSSPNCYLEPQYYSCGGEWIEGGEEMAQLKGQARATRLLGYLPSDVACARRTSERLKLVAEPQTSCSTFVEMFLYEESYYFRYGSPNCQMVAVPFDCDGEELCQNGDNDCLQTFLERALPLANLGYLPQ